MEAQLIMSQCDSCDDCTGDHNFIINRGGKTRWDKCPTNELRMDGFDVSCGEPLPGLVFCIFCDTRNLIRDGELEKMNLDPELREADGRRTCLAPIAHQKSSRIAHVVSLFSYPEDT